jgi:hypothetical protein
MASHEVNHKVQQKDTLWSGKLRAQKRGVDQEPEKEQQKGNVQGLE